MIVDRATLASRALEFVYAPVNQPELLSSLLPLIIGALIIEMYFGKHKTEVLGWNTSVGNAVIWISTGINLLITGAFESTVEKAAVYFIIGVGALIGYMDFFHKWSSSIAFRASSAEAVYPLAYVTVVAVKTDMPIDDLTMKAAAIVIVSTIVFFKILKTLETPAPDDFKNMKMRN